jgi:hypothetical protein
MDLAFYRWTVVLLDLLFTQGQGGDEEYVEVFFYGHEGLLLNELEILVTGKLALEDAFNFLESWSGTRRSHSHTVITFQPCAVRSAIIF